MEQYFDNPGAIFGIGLGAILCRAPWNPSLELLLLGSCCPLRKPPSAGAKRACDGFCCLPACFAPPLSFYMILLVGEKRGEKIKEESWREEERRQDKLWSAALFVLALLAVLARSLVSRFAFRACTLPSLSRFPFYDSQVYVGVFLAAKSAPRGPESVPRGFQERPRGLQESV